MPSRLYSFLANLGTLGLVAGVMIFIIYRVDTPARPASVAATSTTETAAATEAFPVANSTSSATIATTTPTKLATSTAPKVTKISAIKPPTPKAAPSNPAQSPVATSSAPQVTRIQNPYDFAPESFSTVNTDARGALVNILCRPRQGGSLAPISGSGVIIDPRGVILTNAHVAQFLLLSESADINLSCQIRTGSPAVAAWSATVLYIPPVWVSIHASEINTTHPMGTGEHDYALLLIDGAIGNTTLPATFPYLPFDTREAIGFAGDEVLGASYPAEFLGGLAAENGLYPVSSISPINQLLTLSSSTVDVIAIGGVVEAQSGSSGGPVVNQWGRLIGIIATTSDAPTTGARDLRAITMSYIDRDLLTQTGSNLTTYLLGDLTAKAANFNTAIAPGLISQYIQILSK